MQDQSDRPKRTIPIKGPPRVLAVIRKGWRVFIGDPRGRGIWVECENAPAARLTESELKRRLTEGYDGEVHELLQEVGQFVTEESDRQKRVARARRELRRAERAAKRRR